MPLDVLQPAGADLYPILHRSRLHCLSVCNALHFPDISHRCHQVRMEECFSKSDVNLLSVIYENILVSRQEVLWIV